MKFPLPARALAVAAAVVASTASALAVVASAAAVDTPIEAGTIEIRAQVELTAAIK